MMKILGKSEFCLPGKEGRHDTKANVAVSVVLSQFELSASVRGRGVQ